MYAEPGIVDQHVDWPSRVFEPCGHACNVGAIAQVGRHHFNGAAGCPKLCRHLFETVRRPGHEHKIVTPRGECACEGGANARRSTGHESYSHGPYNTVLGEFFSACVVCLHASTGSRHDNERRHDAVTDQKNILQRS
jgi:hypothetical protein